MPRYRIDQYEMHTMQYEIEAADEADAIQRLFAGEGDPVDGSLEFADIVDERGMPAFENPTLAAELRQRGERIDEVIPSICSIEQIE